MSGAAAAFLLVLLPLLRRSGDSAPRLLCAPTTDAFVAWLETVAYVQGPFCDK